MGTKKNLIIDSNYRIMKKLFLFMAISLVSLHEVYSQDYQVADSIVQDTVFVDTIAQDSIIAIDY